MNNKIFDNINFYKELLKIVIPISLQNLLIFFLGLIDNLMVGQLGAIEITGVGLANKFFYLLAGIIFGISSGVSIFTAHYWGRKNKESIHKVAIIGLLAGIIISLIFSLFSFLNSKYIIGIFTNDQSVINAGSQYLKIVSFSFIFIVFSSIFASLYRSTGNVKLPMIITFCSLLINTCLNYLLIFGNFGFPKLGIEGAAIATIISRFFDCSLLLFITYYKKMPAAIEFKNVLNINLKSINIFLKKTLPLILNDLLWTLGGSIYFFVYGRIGTNEITAINVASPIEVVSIAIFIGLSEACVIILGKQIGQKEEKKAYTSAIKIISTGLILSIFIGLSMIIISDSFISLYNISDVIKHYTKLIIIIMGCSLIIKVFNLISSGILRSGGDTKILFFINSGSLWILGIPIALLTGLFFKLEIYFVFLSIIMFDEVTKLIINIIRLVSKKWIHYIEIH